MKVVLFIILLYHTIHSGTVSCCPAAQAGLSSQHMRLSSYLPPELVDAYGNLGMTHDMYQWQVGSWALGHKFNQPHARLPCQAQGPKH